MSDFTTITGSIDSSDKKIPLGTEVWIDDTCVINVEHVVIGSEMVQISNQKDHRNWLTYDCINNYIPINGLLHR